MATIEHHSPYSSVYIATSIGKAAAQEDRYVAIDPLPTIKGDATYRSVFAIFDGHGGKEAAEYCEAKLESVLVSTPAWGNDTKKALSQCLDALERDFTESARHKKITSGCTAVVVVIEHLPGCESIATIANLGDSGAKLLSNSSSSSKWKLQHLTKPHVASNTQEQIRIYENGGYVSQTGSSSGYKAPPYHGSKISQFFQKLKPPRPFRLYPGGMIVSRSIGDIDCKAGGVVGNIPDITQRLISSADRYLCLASDGLWDNISHKNFRHIIKSGEGLGPNGVHKIPSRLINTSNTKGSSDNVTIVLVRIKRVHVGRGGTNVDHELREHAKRSSILTISRNSIRW